MTNATKPFALTIDGQDVFTATTFSVKNPATGEDFAHAPAAGQAELDAAVHAARRAFPGWAATPVAERRAALKRIAGVLNDNLHDLARLLVQEQGKPFADACGDIGGTAYWAMATSDLELPHEEVEGPYGRTVTSYVPIGVCGAIVPWNFPTVLAMFKIAPALLTGNTMVVKPSPFTPLTTLRIGELLRDILPAGVLNIISGGDELGPMMTNHPDIDKISFTGSTQTGKRVMASAAASMKRLTLELGGNDAAIVLPDVDVSAVAEKLFWAAFKNSGQICVATKRVYIHADIYDALSAALVDYARTVKLGDGFEPGVQMGPVQNHAQFERVKALITDAKESGLTFLLGGDVDDSRSGYFLPVTLVDNPPETSRVVQEEAFGPVLPLLKFDDLDDVIARANASPYGLGGSVWSRDLAAAQAVAERLETGTVMINGATSPSPLSAFAGHKQSGLGAENGRAGLLAYTNPKTITVARS